MLGGQKWAKRLKTSQKVLNSHVWCNLKHQKSANALIGGFVTNPFASWLSWQGYFLGVFGGKDGQWAGANLGVAFALVIGFVGYFALSATAIKKQENA